MPKRVLCKFFAQGACLKGDHCEYSHDWKAPPYNICTFYQKGNCAYGSRCKYDHVKSSCLQSSPADLSSTKQLSFRTTTYSVSNGPTQKEREDHIRTWEKKQKHLEALRISREIECSVCLESIMSKPTVSERKFGILSECDHPFCVSCIRNWRSSCPGSGVDVGSALRSCPICRKLSYFVIPSVVWYSSKEEKQEIVDSYKSKLRSIDCKHFDFGNGSCPFASSCFYKHAYRDGTLEEVVLRYFEDEDDEFISKDIRLSQFLSSMRLYD